MVNISKTIRQERDKLIVKLHNLGYSQLGIVSYIKKHASEKLPTGVSPNTVNKVVRAYEASKADPELNSLVKNQIKNEITQEELDLSVRTSYHSLSSYDNDNDNDNDNTWNPVVLSDLTTVQLWYHYQILMCSSKRPTDKQLKKWVKKVQNLTV